MDLLAYVVMSGGERLKFFSVKLNGRQYVAPALCYDLFTFGLGTGSSSAVILMRWLNQS